MVNYRVTAGLSQVFDVLGHNHFKNFEMLGDGSRVTKGLTWLKLGSSWSRP